MSGHVLFRVTATLRLEANPRKSAQMKTVITAHGPSVLGLDGLRQPTERQFVFQHNLYTCTTFPVEITIVIDQGMR